MTALIFVAGVLVGYWWRAFITTHTILTDIHNTEGK